MKQEIYEIDVEIKYLYDKDNKITGVNRSVSINKICIYVDYNNIESHMCDESILREFETWIAKRAYNTMLSKQ